jgi:pilus assembly protein CpaE
METQAQDDLICFLKDKKSVEIFETVLPRLGELKYKILTGGIEDAIPYFESNLYSRAIVVDCEGTELITSQVERLLGICGPDLKLIVVGNKNDVGVFRDLIKLNVYDYLVKPLNGDVLNRSLSGIFRGEEKKPRSGKIVAFIGATGGVGTTTLATSVAHILANEYSKKVILVDADLLFGCIGVILDLKPSHALREVLDSGDRFDSDALEGLLGIYGQNLKVFNSEEPLFEYFAADDIQFMDNFEWLLNILATKYHYIIFDIPRSFTPIWRLVNRKADSVNVLTPISVVGLRDTVRILGVLGEDKVEASANVILSRYPASVIPVGQFEQSLAKTVVAHIPHSDMASEAINLGKPLAEISESYRQSLQGLIETVSGTTVLLKNQPQKSLWTQIRHYLSLGG